MVRLGAMGDILHALPAAASLKRSFPDSPLTWVVEKTWAPLLRNNSCVDHVVELDRRAARSWLETLSDLRRRRFSVAMDLQGLVKSALTAALARPERLVGYDRRLIREPLAGVFYSNRVSSAAAHVVDRNLDVARAAGAAHLTHDFPLPAGDQEGALPDGPFVLASPLAGWVSKQWPLEYFAELAEALRERFEAPLVLNGPASELSRLRSVSPAIVHASSVSGLIYATRRAAAVVGVDSGPLHLAAALAKPGVAIFGPTDPSRNGPYGGTIQVLRAPGADVRSIRGDYERGSTIHPTMRAVRPAQVLDALAPTLERVT